MRKTKTFEREVWVCDDCANELEVNLLAKCDKCGKELCHECAVRFCVELTKWDDGRGTISHLVYSSEGDRASPFFYEQDMLNDYELGRCCCCGTEGNKVRNIITLNRKAPVPGTGWGCFLCGLPSDGALYVCCDSCLESEAEPQEVVYGHLTEQKRLPVSKIPEGVFKHNTTSHGAYCLNEEK